jgi:hypothetical protein
LSLHAHSSMPSISSSASALFVTDAAWCVWLVLQQVTTILDKIE